MVALSYLFWVSLAIAVSAHPFHIKRQTVIEGAISGDINGVPQPLDGTIPGEPATFAAATIGPGGCNVLDQASFDAIPGKQAIFDYVDREIGTGGKLTLNPSQYPNNQAIACGKSDTIATTYTSPPTCQVTSSLFEGTVGEGQTEVTVSITQGQSTTTSVSVESASSFGASTEFGVSFSALDLFDVGVTQTFSTEFSNSRGETNTVTNDVSVTNAITATATKAGTCAVSVELTSCTAESTFGVPILADGWVWFFFDDRTKDHFHWAINIAAVLAEDQRTSMVNMKAKIDGKFHGTFSSECK